MSRSLLLLIFSLSLNAFTSSGGDELDARAVDARTSDGAEVLLLCSEDPVRTAEQLSRTKGVEVREVKRGEIYSFDQPIWFENEHQRVFVSQLANEPCVSGMERQDAVDATNFGIGLGVGIVALPIVLSLAIIMTPGVQCC